MDLFHSPTSPFVRKVMLLALHAGRAGEVTLVHAMGTPLEPGSLPLAENPLGKVPALRLDDGRILYDSRVICRYLDDLWHAGAYPAGAALWDALVVEATADGMMEAAVLMRYETHIKPEGSRSSEWTESQWAKVARSLDALEQRWLPLLADGWGMAQMAVTCALGYLDFRHDARGWRDGRPGLAAFADTAAARPEVKATRPPG
jgi:glutathione S-transferase